MSMTVEEALEVFNSGCNDIYKVQVATHTAIKALEEVQKYRAIGTVSEFRELKEKATAKKPIPFIPDCTSIRFFELVCPNCKEKVQDILMPPYCKCGQHLDWSRGKE